ncbi:unnamed protein product [Linum tenue]|uniref:6,7-dimethyl-8-ribityllumazine synthase n=2 Tax=Linum tenue TaxID=586396 RepID=A0AAV0Q131_9ROSI|nr:unnamed protein product [Linum tenue]
MKKSIRCCISCILPCGALDVIRIVHTNGRVEEISGSIRAADVMRLHPKHVLKKPSSCIGAVVPKIVIVPPDAELQRGKIYFLMPLPPDARSNKKQRKDHHRHHNRNNVVVVSNINDHDNHNNNNTVISKTDHSSTSDVVVSSDDRYLSEIMSEKQRDHRRRGRAGVWRPHLESISESASFLNVPTTHPDDEDDDSF